MRRNDIKPQPKYKEIEILLNSMNKIIASAVVASGNIVAYWIQSNELKQISNTTSFRQCFPLTEKYDEMYLHINFHFCAR